MRISDWSSDVCSSDLPLSSRGPAMRRALAALAGFAAIAGGALALAQNLTQNDVFDPQAIAARERERLVTAKQQSARAMARSGTLETQARKATNAADRLKKRSAALAARIQRSEEPTSELQSLMRISYAAFWL